MRCISPHANYSIQVFEAQEEIVRDARGYATTVLLKKPVIADFQQGGLMDHEIEAALEHFNFSGIPEGVNPLTRVSSFDVEAFVQRFDKKKERDEMYTQICDRLRELQERHPGEFQIVEQPRAARPWPSYDGDTVEEILMFRERLQVDPTTIRLYELENQGRKEIVEAMLAIEDPEYLAQLKGGEDGEIVVQA